MQGGLRQMAAAVSLSGERSSRESRPLHALVEKPDAHDWPGDAAVALWEAPAAQTTSSIRGPSVGGRLSPLATPTMAGRNSRSCMR